MKQRIAVIGTGRMGSALVRAFLKSGYPTLVWNRTRSKAEPLAKAGARLAETVKDAIAEADVVVVNLNDYETSLRALEASDAAAALRGKTLVQLTSGSPRQARELAAWASERGAQYLDGAIMTTPNFIGDEGATLLYSGPTALFEQCLPLLRSLGGKTVHVGTDAGHASALDSALLAYLWGAMFGALHGVAVVEAEGLSLGGYLEHVTATTPMVNEAVIDTVTRIQKRLYQSDEATLASLDAHVGALRHLLEVSKDRGIRSTLPEAFEELCRPAIAAGHAQDDFAVLNKFMRPSHDSPAR
jgi:3-hydroxyisobutyrate dehydrogenase-like beta-hydroxyacid dehydrogenase